MFRGSHSAKVEDSGRFKMPVAYKTLLDQHHIDEFYVTSADGKSAEVWPLAEWENVERGVEADTVEEHQDDLQRFKEVTSWFGQQLKMDGQGRFVLPQKLRLQAKLDGDVVVFGRTNYLEVCNQEMAEQSVQASLMTKAERNRVTALAKQNVHS